jgi:hypothetical protein
MSPIFFKALVQESGFLGTQNKLRLFDLLEILLWWRAGKP